MADYSPSTITRFWANVDKRGPDECWPWLGSFWPKGYGRMKPQGSRYYRGATKISYELHKGPITSGLLVCHSCDNPPCVNPQHLWVGTNLENQADAKAKGRLRTPRSGAGADNPRSLITEAQAREIVARLLNGETNRSIAADYPISEGMVSLIKRRKAWTHLWA